MDLYELMELFVDESQLVRIYDADSINADVIYEGNFDELPEEMETYTVSSIDNVYKDTDGYVGINVETN